jgi:hypothetical protein
MDEVTLVVVLGSGRVMKMKYTEQAARGTVKFVDSVLRNKVNCLCLGPHDAEPQNWCIKFSDISAVFIEDDDTYLYNEDEV